MRKDVPLKDTGGWSGQYQEVYGYNLDHCGHFRVEMHAVLAA